MRAFDTLEEAKLGQQLAGVYTERNALVCALSKIFAETSCIIEHDPNDANWDPEWRTIICIDAPVPGVGQMTWHVHDSERPMFRHLPLRTDVKWDGHTTAEKYRRLSNMMLFGVVAPELSHTFVVTGVDS